jgi:endonuclease/exonuclease/phosphatase family metal-dependent hydrolase
MTYNVHACVGFDGRCVPERYARIIARHVPDIVALQEIDVGRRRTGGLDQAKAIAGLLDMEYFFHPCVTSRGSHYGIAMLGQGPLLVRRAERLPSLGRLEHRGALWVELTWRGRIIHVVNTHLSLSPAERTMQVRALLGEHWLKGVLSTPGSRVVLCGDLNMVPGSAAHRILSRQLRDTQAPAAAATWMNILRLDYIFISDGLDIDGIETARTHLTRLASDHLPLIADVRIVPHRGAAESRREGTPLNKVKERTPCFSGKSANRI